MYVPYLHILPASTWAVNGLNMYTYYVIAHAEGVSNVHDSVGLGADIKIQYMGICAYVQLDIWH